jgi:hypothetical protein
MLAVPFLSIEGDGAYGGGPVFELLMPDHFGAARSIESLKLVLEYFDRLFSVHLGNRMGESEEQVCI